MYTSYYANVKKLPSHLTPIAISIGLPKWWDGKRDKRLAPTWKMMKSSREVYDIEFKKHLLTLNPKQVFDQLGDNAVLICYEVHNDFCHRRLVAEWLEESLNIVIPEYGFDREDTFPYAECNEENKGKLRRQVEHKRKMAESFLNEVLEEPEKPKAQKTQQQLSNERQMTFFDLL